MSTPLPPTTTQSSTSFAQFASIQISDALIKFSLYLQKVTDYQQFHSREHEPKCQKLVRLMLQAFIKYAQTQEFSKQSYEMVKSCIIMKKSYYSLIMLDLMMKNNKYVIKQVKKQLQPMLKLIWQKVSTQPDPLLKQSRIQNLKVIIRCWGYIFGDRLQETIRRWLEAKYNIKRIELSEENERVLRETYGDKLGKQGGKTISEREGKLSEALLSSLIDDDNHGGSSSIYISGSSNVHTGIGTHTTSTYLQSRQSIPSSDPRMYRYQTSFNQIPQMNSNQQPPKNSNDQRPSHSANLPNNYTSQPQTTKPKSLEGMNKSLLEALDLS